MLLLILLNSEEEVVVVDQKVKQKIRKCSQRLCPFRATPTQRSGQRSGVGAGSPGTRKEAGERDTGASDRRCGEEVTGGGPSCDLMVCVWAPSVTFVVFFPLSSGGVSHGPRGPTSYYYMLPMKVRVQGLKVALSSKAAQVTFRRQ